MPVFTVLFRRKIPEVQTSVTPVSILLGKGPHITFYTSALHPFSFVMYLYDTHLSNKSINIHSITKWSHTHPFILTCTKYKYNSNKFDPSSTVTAPCALVVCLSPSRFHRYETLFRHAKFPVAGSSLRLSVRHGLFSSKRKWKTNLHLSL